MEITLTQKDIDKAKIQNSESGMLIDELAYSAGQWTSEELYENNFHYEPQEPYQFNFESDLLANTKTEEDIYKVIKALGMGMNANITTLAKKAKLQAGAWIALNDPEQFATLLETYTDYLKENGTDQEISKDYAKELQEARDSYQDDSYREWLNGDRSNYAGVVYEIAKYFTDARDGSYTKHNADTKTEAFYTFELSSKEDIENAKDSGYNKRQLKAWILDSVRNSGEARKQKDKQESEKRKDERERLTAYKAEQNTKAEAKRKVKLLSMTLNK